MSQLANTCHPDLPPTPTAQQSINAVKCLFAKGAKRKTLRAMYDNLPDKSRGLILIAGGLSPKDFKRDFDSFDDLELQKIRAGMQLIKTMVMTFDRKVGDVRRLKHSDICNVN